MKKSRILGILFTVAITFMLVWMMIAVNGGSIVAVLDLPTIAGIFICVPLLWASGYGKDFLNAIKITFCDTEFEERELLHSEKSCSFLLKVLWIEAFLFTLVDFLGVFNNLDDESSFGSGVALSLLPFFYALILSLFILLIKCRVERSCKA